MADKQHDQPKVDIEFSREIEPGRNGGWRPNSGRPPTTLKIKLPKDTMKALNELSRRMGMPPDKCVENLIIAHMQVKPDGYPKPAKAALN